MPSGCGWCGLTATTTSTSASSPSPTNQQEPVHRAGRQTPCTFLVFGRRYLPTTWHCDTACHEKTRGIDRKSYAPAMRGVDWCVSFSVVTGPQVFSGPYPTCLYRPRPLPRPRSSFSRSCSRLRASRSSSRRCFSASLSLAARNPPSPSRARDVDAALRVPARGDDAVSRVRVVTFLHRFPVFSCCLALHRGFERCRGSRPAVQPRPLWAETRVQALGMDTGTGMAPPALPRSHGRGRLFSTSSPAAAGSETP